MKILIILISILILSLNIVAQNLESRIPSIIDRIEKPVDIESFNPIFHFPPVNQDTTYVCWSFSTLSFIETEANRLGNKPVKLSMMFPVYYGYIEKAKLFVETRGQSRFTPGDLFITVFDVINAHGIIPLDGYKGETRNCMTFNHDALYAELNIYIDNVKKKQNWQEDNVIAGLKVILNKHLGAPPDQFNYNGKKYTPTSFAKEYINLPWDDYILVTTFMYDKFDSYIILDVPDNI